MIGIPSLYPWRAQGIDWYSPTVTQIDTDEHPPFFGYDSPRTIGVTFHPGYASGGRDTCSAYTGSHWNDVLPYLETRHYCVLHAGLCSPGAFPCSDRVYPKQNLYGCSALSEEVGLVFSCSPLSNYV